MSCFQYFKEDTAGITLPKKFTFPFYYDPHPLAVLAAKEVQMYLESRTDFKHNFGLDNHKEGAPVGKMFGVLVVENQHKEIGYLAAFSGKLVDGNLIEKFVPPVFMLNTKEGFYREGEDEVNAINKEVADLETAPHFIALQKEVKAKTLAITEKINEEKRKVKAAKKDRKARRKEAEQELSPEAFEAFKIVLIKESYRSQKAFREQSEELSESLLEEQKKLAVFTDKLAKLKTARKNKSSALQQKIFDSYQFLNQEKKKKKLTEIFPAFREQKPPAGSGDCSAPKLLQYAFLNDLRPISMAEFWWGMSPSSEIRKHKNYYPACGGRCKPILGHMLEGIELDENPFLKESDTDKKIDIVFEDEALLIINKPPELLSVPGKQIMDSVYTRMEALLPDATGPLIVHRLDMSTSGILIITKTKEAHKIIQSQFAKRTIKKRYVALLDGEVEQNEGDIDLPLRVDLNDRPRQLVCYEYGKRAKTRWKVMERRDGKTRVHLYPITGRTHQLRVHVSHASGLNTPIIGDDLYGQKEERLHLHAEFIEFVHPTTKETISFTVAPDF